MVRVNNGHCQSEYTRSVREGVSEEDTLQYPLLSLSLSLCNTSNNVTGSGFASGQVDALFHVSSSAVIRHRGKE